jgi:hypothetical protein
LTAQNVLSTHAPQASHWFWQTTLSLVYKVVSRILDSVNPKLL